MTFSLRPYQSDLIKSVRALMLAGERSILVQAATGSGKTALAAYMLGTAQAKGNRCLFSVHRRELLNQSAAMFESVGVPYGVIAADYNPPRGSRLYHHGANIQIASVQTLVRRLGREASFDMIITDEVHHTVSPTWRKISAASPRAFNVGLTATPWRLDGQGLRPFFNQMVQGPSIPWLTENGFLAPYELYAPPSVDLKGIKRTAGDFDQGQAAAAFDRSAITGDILKHWLALANGKRTLGFAASVPHSKHLTERFNQAGISAVHVDANTASDIRDAAFEGLRAGSIQVVFNVDLAGEGFDCPAVEAVILARPTLSLGIYLQQVGRALRPSPDKAAAIILDHAGNSSIHGLPDAERIWDLDGQAAGNGKVKNAQAPLRTCPACFRQQTTRGPVCKYCVPAVEFTSKARTLDELAGELERVTPARGVPVAAGPRPIKLGDGFSHDDEQELVRRFERMRYPRPHLVAKDIINRRKFLAGVTP